MQPTRAEHAVRRLSDNPLFMPASQESSMEAAGLLRTRTVRLMRIEPPEYSVHPGSEDEGGSRAGGRWTGHAEDWEGTVEQPAVGARGWAAASPLVADGVTASMDVLSEEEGSVLEPGDSMAHVMTLKGLQAQLIARQIRLASQSAAAHARELRSTAEAAPTQVPSLSVVTPGQAANQKFLLARPALVKPWSLKSLRAAEPMHNMHSHPLPAVHGTVEDREAVPDWDSLALIHAAALPLPDNLDAMQTGGSSLQRTPPQRAA